MSVFTAYCCPSVEWVTRTLCTWYRIRWLFTIKRHLQGTVRNLLWCYSVAFHPKRPVSASVALMKLARWCLVRSQQYFACGNRIGNKPTGVLFELPAHSQRKAVLCSSCRSYTPLFLLSIGSVGKGRHHNSLVLESWTQEATFCLSPFQPTSSSYLYFAQRC